MKKIILACSLLILSAPAFSQVGDAGTKDMGHGFNLATLDVTGGVDGGTTIFNYVVEECLGTPEKGSDIYSFVMSNHTSELLSHYDSMTNLKGNYQTKSLNFNTTMNTHVRLSQWQTRDVRSKAMTFYVHADHPAGWYLRRDSDCWDSKYINQDLIADLQDLKTNHPITDPGNAAQWHHYVDFLNKWGSHILTGKIRGARFVIRSSIYSASTITDKQLEIKACVSAEGESPDSEKSLDICEKYSKHDRESVKDLKIELSRTVTGGTHDTRAELVAGFVNQDEITKFLKEADDADQPTEHHFFPIWEVILLSEEFSQEAHNLAAAYNGIVANNGCGHRTARSKLVQGMTVYAKDKELTLYGCWAKAVGAISNDDCHFHGEKCYCYGKGCVDTDNENPIGDPTAKPRNFLNTIRTGKSGSTWHGVNNSCHVYALTSCHKNAWQDGLHDRWLWSPSD